MENVSGYKVKLLSQRRNLAATRRIFRDAVKYLIPKIRDEWEALGAVTNEKVRQSLAERLFHTTKQNAAKYDFDAKFPLMPSYFRRAAIKHALGAVSSYLSLHAKWGKRHEGKEPSLAASRFAPPTFYKSNMSLCDGALANKSPAVRLKLYDGKSWNWHEIPCRKQDLNYISRRWQPTQASAPVLTGRKDKFYLVFSFAENIPLREINPENSWIVGVDLGIGSDAVCSLMRSDGTVEARRFINFPSEKDRMERILNRIRGERRKFGKTGGKKHWRIYNCLARDHAIKVSRAVSAFAIESGTDVIVFEHLEMKGKIRGGRKQRLALWRKNEIQKRVEWKAHKSGIRISRICAWNTSRLAFDGSGDVMRGREIGDGTPYDICWFQTGKIYNCDLNASYNIAARWFLRELAKIHDWMLDVIPKTIQRTLWHLRNLKASPATAGCRSGAKVPCSGRELLADDPVLSPQTRFCDAMA